MDTKSNAKTAQSTVYKKFKAVLSVTLAFILVMTITPITNALANDDATPEQLLDLKLTTPTDTTAETDSVQDTTITTSEDVSLLGNDTTNLAPVAAGSAFKYWNTEADGSGTSHSAGETIAILSDLTAYDENGNITPNASEFLVTEHHVDREGNAVAGDTSVIVLSAGSYTGANTQSVANRVYVGPEYTAPDSSSPSTVTGGAAPTIASVTDNAEVWYIYGRDNGGGTPPGPGGGGTTSDGVEDIDVTRHWLFISDGVYVPVGGTTTDTQIVNIGGSFTLDEDDPPTPTVPAGYTYLGFLTDQDALTATPIGGNPAITASVADGNRDVYYVYQANPYWVAFHIVDEVDAAIPSITPPPAYTVLMTGTTWGPITAPNGGPFYSYTGWKQGLLGIVRTDPIQATVAIDNMDIYLVYRAITYSVSYDINGGTSGTGPTDDTVVPSTTHPLNSSIIPTHAQSSGTDIIFIGWTETRDTKIYTKDDTSGPNTVGSVFVDDDKTVYAAWGLDKNKNNIPDVYETWFTVTENYVDESGNSLGGGAHDTATSVGYQDAFSTTAKSIPGYTYKGWRLDGGVLQSGNPSIASVNDASTVTLVYGVHKEFASGGSSGLAKTGDSNMKVWLAMLAGITICVAVYALHLGRTRLVHGKPEEREL